MYIHYANWKKNKEIEIVYISIDTDKQAFTDAYANFSCCSYLSNTGDAPLALPNYDEYNDLKILLEFPTNQ